MCVPDWVTLLLLLTSFVQGKGTTEEGVSQPSLAILREMDHLLRKFAPEGGFALNEEGNVL